MPRIYPSTQERFDAKWKLDRKTGCHLWTAGRDDRGRGYFWLNGQMTFASRAAWQIYFGPIPDGLDVLHTCDRPRCVNKSHLFLGTKVDNAQDKIAKGRAANLKGERNPAVKLTPRKVRAIRASKQYQKVIAARYGISQQTVSDIKARKKWKHL